MRSIVLAITILILAPGSRAQQLNAGILPELILSKSVGKNWRFTAKLATMHSLLEKKGESAVAYEHLQTDLQLFAALNLRPQWNVAWGYHYLYTDGHAHRFIQQLTLVQKKHRFRLGHRGRVDATFLQGDTPLIRLRYRLAFEIPLAGHSLDANEFYLLFSEEPITRFRTNQFELENRIGAALGRAMRNHSKVELGIDYRTRDMDISTQRHIVMLRFGWFVNF